MRAKKMRHGQKNNEGSKVTKNASESQNADNQEDDKVQNCTETNQAAAPEKDVPPPPEVSEFPCSLLVASDRNDVISFNSDFINFANDLINFLNELMTKIAYSFIPIAPSPGPSSVGCCDRCQC